MWRPIPALHSLHFVHKYMWREFQAGDWRALDTILTYHGTVTLPHRYVSYSVSDLRTHILTKKRVMICMLVHDWRNSSQKYDAVTSHHEKQIHYECCCFFFFRLAILSNFPEIQCPSEYEVLLPEAGCVFDVLLLKCYLLTTIWTFF